jgi:exoribonuclease R
MRKVIDLLMKQITKAKLAGKPKEFIQNLQQQLDKIIKNESNNKREN